jgi:hypothetical protein
MKIIIIDNDIMMIVKGREKVSTMLLPWDSTMGEPDLFSFSFEEAIDSWAAARVF